MTSYSTKLVFLIICFVSGIGLGLGSWNHISLPFHNPLEVVGFCTKIQFNPANDVLRFFILILTPSLILILISVLGLPKVEPLFKEKKTISSSFYQDKSGSSSGWLTLILLCVYAVLLALNVPTYHSFGRFDAYHEGEVLGSSLSWIAGQAPYRDFLFFHGLFQDPLRAVLAFKIFGASIGAVRTMESLLKLSTWLLAALFLHKLFRGKILWTLGVLSFVALAQVRFCFDIFGTLFIKTLNPAAVTNAFLKYQPFWQSFDWMIIPSRDVTTFGCLLAWFMVYNEIFFKQTASKYLFRISVFSSAFLPVISFAYALDRGFYLIANGLLLSAGVYYFELKKRRLGKDFLVLTAAGALTALLALILLFQGQFLSFLKYVFWIMPSYKELSEKLPCSISEGRILFPCLLLAAYLFFLVFRWLLESRDLSRRKYFLKNYGFEIILLLLAISYFGNFLQRSDWEHMVYSSCLLYIGLFYTVTKQVYFSFLKSRFIREWMPRFVTGLIFAIASLCLVHLLRGNVIQQNFPLRMTDTELMSPAYEETVRFLRDKIKPGDGFFTMTSEASWYYSLGQVCPTRFPYIWTAAPLIFQAEIVQSLSMKKVKWVLYKDADWSYTIDGISNEEKFPIIARFIQHSYRPYKSMDGNEIWVLKDL